jgi:predicted RNase H-like HicB family nuclease
MCFNCDKFGGRSTGVAALVRDEPIRTRAAPIRRNRRTGVILNAQGRVSPRESHFPFLEVTMLRYAVTLARRYDGLFTATFPDVPDAVACGRDDQEALEEAARSLDAALVRRTRQGLPLPSARTAGALTIAAGAGSGAVPMPSPA